MGNKNKSVWKLKVAEQGLELLGQLIGSNSPIMEITADKSQISIVAVPKMRMEYRCRVIRLSDELQMPLDVSIKMQSLAAHHRRCSGVVPAIASVQCGYW